MLHDSCTEKAGSSVQDLEGGEDGYGSGQVTVQESCGLIYGANPIGTPTTKINSME